MASEMLEENTVDQIELKDNNFITFFIALTASVVVLISALFIISNRYTHSVERLQQIAATTANTRIDLYRLEANIEKSHKQWVLTGALKKDIYKIKAINTYAEAKNDLYNIVKGLQQSGTEGDLEKHVLRLNNLMTGYENLLVSKLGDSRALEANEEEVDEKVAEFLGKSDNTFHYLTAEEYVEKIQTLFFEMDIVLQNLYNRQVDDALFQKRKQTSVFIVGILLNIIIFALFTKTVRKSNSYIIGHAVKMLASIARGEEPQKMNAGKSDFRDVFKESNNLIEYLNSATEFANKIGEGKYNHPFEPKSEKDALGNSLVQMKDKLQQVAREDKVRNWQNEGLAKFSDLIRQYNNQISQLSEKLLSNLVNYMKAIQGGMYILTENEEQGNYELKLVATYAYGRKKFHEKTVQIGEGLVGQVYVEGKTVFLKEIPEDHFEIDSGLGESKPTSVMIVPLKDEESIVGVIVLVSLNMFEEYEISFVESLGEIISSSIKTVRMNEQTQKLLEEAKQKEEEMKAQEEELRQNMEELAATQEQMERLRREEERKAKEKQSNDPEE